MPKLTKRTVIILGSSLIFFGVLSGLFISNWINYQGRLQFLDCDDPNGCVTIYGIVREEQTIGYNYLKNNNTFEYYDNVQAEMLNSWETEWSQTWSGVSLADILEKTQCLDEDASRVIFESEDGFRSFELPISVILENPSSVLICNKERGKIIKSKEDGGDGPLRVYVVLSILVGNEEITEIFAENGKDFVYNSVYAVKYFSAVHVI